REVLGDPPPQIEPDGRGAPHVADSAVIAGHVRPVDSRDDIREELERMRAPPPCDSGQPAIVGDLSCRGSGNEGPLDGLLPPRDIATRLKPPVTDYRAGPEDAEWDSHLGRPPAVVLPDLCIPDAIPLRGIVGIVEAHAVAEHAR